ncbi:hypothetical protein AMELA_G00227180, partial [Ameiurus melas]
MSQSKTISLHIEDFAQWHIWIIILVIVVVILVIVAAVINQRRKRVEAQEENSGKGAEKAQQVGENTHDKQTKPQLNNVPQLDDETMHKEEVTYATVFVNDKKPKQGYELIHSHTNHLTHMIQYK